MRRPLRALLNSILAVSLAIPVAIATLWLRSYWVNDYARYQRPAGNSPYVISSRGWLQCKFVDYSYPPATASWYHFTRGADRDFIGDDGRAIERWEHGGERFLFLFEAGHGARVLAGIQWSPPRQYSYYYFNTPHAVLAILTALPGLIVTRRLFTRNHYQKGNCPVCGYDLRATPERCPECGTLPG